MLHTRCGLCHLALATITLAALAATPPALAFDVLWTGGTGSWTAGGNWDTLSQPGDFGFTEDVGVINNGGTATLNTTAFDSGALNLGYEITDPNGPVRAPGHGTLIIQSGGSLTLVDNPEASASNVTPNGAANVGLEGGDGTEDDSGLLEIQGGGSLTAVTFDINQHGTLRIGGGTGAATATTTSGSLFSNGTVEVMGPGHNISIAANLAFESKAAGNSRYVPHITPSGTSVISAGGTAQLTGTLAPVFEGVTPQVGDYWDLFDVTGAQGTFTNYDPSGAPAPGPGTAYTTRVVDGGTNGKILQFGLQAFATLKIDTDAGTMSLVSESGDPINMVSYAIGSSSGRIAANNWTSLADQGKVGWTEASGTATGLHELNPENSLAMSTTAISLGNVLAPPAEFGVAPDITFQYGVDGELSPINGVIEYTGSGAINNLLLTVNPDTGEGQLKNSSPFSIDLLGYSILSDSGSLDEAGWDSLDNQGVGGWDDGQEYATSNDEFALSELVPLDPAETLTSNAAFSLGNMFQMGGSQDLALEFYLLVDGVPETRQGIVQYGEIPDVSLPLGDFSGDGQVDGADLSLLLGFWGASVPPIPSGWNGTPPTAPLVDGDDLSALLGTWGQGIGPLSAGSAAVPEPASITLLGALALAGGVCMRRRRS